VTGEADVATVSTFRLDKYLVTVGRFRQFRDAVLPPDGGPGWVPLAGSGIHTHVNGGRGLVGASPSPDAGPAYETGWRPGYDFATKMTDKNLTTCEWTVGPNFAYSTWTTAPGSNENLPMDCVAWEEAYAFCIWDGGFLPSEAEWEYAGAGGSEQRVYPWGSASPGAANAYAIYGCNYPSGTGRCNCTDPIDGGVCDGAANIAPVGSASAGAGLWGQLDLIGDIWEWNLDWFLPYITPCSDCANLTSVATSDYHVLRGGGFGYPYASYGIVSTPDPSLPTSRDTFPAVGRTFIRGFGFRCARPPAGP
jgi:formylglycine-generating enzyme required for sulfatase activity